MTKLLSHLVIAISVYLDLVNALPEPALHKGRRSTITKSTSPTVILDSGVIIGTTTTVPSATASVYQFLGVPFAVSPPKSFAPPEKVKPWSQPINTTTRSPACMEQFMGDAETVNITKTLFAYPDAIESEDCLYLNVFVPATATADKAVMNWIFPGNLYFGDASRPQYDGSSFAANHDIIVVAGNYRTNAFGFSNSPEIPITGRNAGFYDQRLILDWIQRNIAAFGGSPSRVLIFGESSGASSVDRLVTTNNAPFRAAIAQSGSASVSAYPDYYSTSWPTLANITNCSTATSQLSCVRSAGAFTIKSIIETNYLIFGPENDNITQLATPTLYRRSAHLSAQVPYLIGTNGGEGYPFMIGFDNLTTAIHYDLYNPSDSQVSAIQVAYPVTTYFDNTTNVYDVVSQLFTDIYFTCPTGLIARSTATANSNLNSSTATTTTGSIYRYFFNQSYPNLQLLLPTPLNLDLHSYHTIEASLIFGTFPLLNTTTPEIQMSAFLQKTWADFAKSPENGPGWIQVQPDQGADNEVKDIGEFTVVFGDDDDDGEGKGKGKGKPGIVLRKERDLDGRCNLFDEQYESVVYPAF
ncbi:putative para-nitrobenzyl esterase [Phaeomoniella chlamydospora]|uniref:Carboxylic ester hydrolase n=1 Tax=Phaeomoniella chlamydospora TaxID=158046 RepID=A0A0G2H8V2_PHACM|nr:putative para-nitrobenzyl esterase [Phaeomoniella chlamydospora]